MRIIFLTISYNQNGNSIYNDLINSLINHNHQITICRSNCEIGKTTLKKVNENLHILDIQTGNQFEKNLIKKGINMLFLERQFIKAIKKNLQSYSFDLVLYATPPISLNGVVEFCKKNFNAKSFLMLKDIFPQNAIDLKMIKKNSFIHKFFSKKEEKLYRISDYIGCMSQKNKDYLKKYDLSIQQKSHIFFNSVKISDEKDEEIPASSQYTVFLFGGNIGKPQNINYLLKIIDYLKTYPKSKFIIVGKGTEKEIVENYAKTNSRNFKYINFLEKEEYENLLKSADIGLISLDPRFTIANIPSKLPTYYNLKKPVLAITDTCTDLKDMILENECGWWCDANDMENIINTIKEICESKEEQKRRGLNAYNYLKEYFDVEINVKQIENFMEETK